MRGQEPRAQRGWTKVNEVMMFTRRADHLIPGLVVLLLLGSLHAQSPDPADNLPTRQLLSRYGLERVWWNQAVMNPSRETVRHLSIDEELTYVQSTGGVISAFDNATGKRLWAVLLGRRDEPSMQAVSNDEAVLVAVGVKLYTLQKWTGDILSVIDLSAAPSIRPATDEKQVYIGSLDGSVYAYDLKTIRELDAENLLPEWSYKTLNWRYQTGARVTTPPISNGTVVNFASRNGSLYSVSADKRELLFQFETNAPVSAPLVRVGGFLYVASEDFNLYCIDANSGQVRWEFTAGLPIRQAPRVIGDHVFLAPSSGGLFCLTKASGRQLWWDPKLTQFLAASTSNVYASDELGNVVVLSRPNGAVLGAIPLRSFSVRLSNDRTDRLFLSTRSGMVVCLRERGREFPVYHMHPERQPILPEFAEDAPPPPAK